MTAEPAATFVVEYGCERLCRVEYDTSDLNPRATHGMMLQQADAAHDAAHKAEPPVMVHRHAYTVLVKAGAL